jgi:hypothetical protein
MDLSTSCSTHCDVTLNALTTLNAIRMIYSSLYAVPCWSQLDSLAGCGLLRSCPISGIRRNTMTSTINTFRSVADVITMAWQQTGSSSSRKNRARPADLNG